MSELPLSDAITLGAAGVSIVSLSAAELLKKQYRPNLRQHRGFRGFGPVGLNVKPGLADAVLYRRLVRPDMIKLSNGAYLSFLRLRAPDASSYDGAGLMQADVGLAKVLSQVDARTVLHMHEHHTRHAEYDMPEFYPNPYLEFLDKDRARDFLIRRPPYRSLRTLAIAWMPTDDRLERIQGASSVNEKLDIEERTLQEFDQRLLRFEQFARSYAHVERLGEVVENDPYGIERRYSQPLEHLMWCLYGRSRRVCVPEPGMAINGLLTEEFRGGYDLRIDNQEVRVLIVKRVPDRSRALLFSRLHELQVDYGFCVRFIPLSGEEIRKELGGASTEWMSVANSRRQVDPHAVEMMESARQAVGAASAGLVRFGRTTITLVLRAKKVEEVEAASRRALALLDEIGFPAFRARVAAEDGFYGYLPGNGYHNVRKNPLHALNITHIFSFHEQNLGRRYSESISFSQPRVPALMCMRSGAGDAMYRAHLNSDPRDVFDHIGIGKKGSGKSTLLAQIIISWLGRYPFAGATVVDRGRSMYRLARFLDAAILDLPVLGSQQSIISGATATAAGGMPAYPGFALFAGVTDRMTPEREFLMTVLESCIELQGVAATGQRQQRLIDAIDRVLSLPEYLRDLTALNEQLQDPEGIMQPALKPYLRGGSLGSTIDTPQDSMKFSRLTMIEIGRLASGNTNSKLLVPTFAVAFYKARAAVEARKKRTNNYDWNWLYEFDEVGPLLDNPQGEAFVLDMIKQGRKEKHAVGLWGQVPNDITQSNIKSDILSACGARFYFRDTGIDAEDTRRSYDKMALPARAITRLGAMPPRTVMMHTPADHDTQELRSDFSKLWLAIIGRSTKADNQRLDDYILRFPQTWRQEILRYEGVDSRTIDEMTALVDASHRQDQVWDDIDAQEPAVA